MRRSFRDSQILTLVPSERNNIHSGYDDILVGGTRSTSYCQSVAVIVSSFLLDKYLIEVTPELYFLSCSLISISFYPVYVPVVPPPYSSSHDHGSRAILVHSVLGKIIKSQKCILSEIAELVSSWSWL